MEYRLILLFALFCLCGCSDFRKVEMLRAEAQDLKEEVEVLKASAAIDAKKADSKLTVLKIELESLRAQSSADLKKANDEVKLLKEQLASLKEKDKTLSEEAQEPGKKKLRSDEVHNLIKLARTKMELDDLNKNLLSSQDNIAHQESDLNLLTKEIEGLNDQLAKRRNNITKLREELEKGAETIEFAGRTFTANEVQQDLKARFNAFKTLESLSAEREREHQRLTSLLQTARDDLEDAKARRETRQSELEGLRIGVPKTAADRLLELIENIDGTHNEERLKSIFQTLDDIAQPAQEPK